MTSREIAELTGKAHFNVLVDVHKMLSELGEDELKFQGIYVPLRRWCKAHEVTPETVPDKRYPKGVKAWPDKITSPVQCWRLTKKVLYE